MAKTLKIALLIVAFGAILGTYSVMAYLTDSKTVRNVFTLGGVSIELIESNWNPENAKNVGPGQTVSKNPVIKNIGYDSAFVYIKIVVPKVILSNGKVGPLFTYNIGSDWKEITSKAEDDDTTYTKVYYHTSSLSQSDSTQPLFTEVTVANYSPTVTGEQFFHVIGFGIQAETDDDEETIIEAYDSF